MKKKMNKIMDLIIYGGSVLFMVRAYIIDNYSLASFWAIIFFGCLIFDSIESLKESDIFKITIKDFKEDK